MTAPVPSKTPDSTGSQLGDPLHQCPCKLDAANAPRHHVARVRLRETLLARFAVLRFSGLARPRTCWGPPLRSIADAWFKSHYLHATGPISLAQTTRHGRCGFMCCNEVMVEVE